MKRRWVLPSLPIITTLVTPMVTFVSSTLIMMQSRIWLFVIGVSGSEPSGWMFWERFRFFEDFTGFPYPYALLVVGWLLAGLALAAILFFIGTRTLDLPIASGLVMIVLAFQLVFPAFIIFSATDFLSYNGIFVELDAVLSMPFPSVVSLIGLGIFYIMNKKS